MSGNLPRISRAAVDAIMGVLKSQQGMRRPPEKAAKLLALIVALHKQGRPFPPRDEVAAAIGAAVSTVDAALSTRLNEGYIKLDVETPRGNVRRRNSVIRERYYIPSNQLQDTVDKAEQREITAKLANIKNAMQRDSRGPRLQPVYDQWRTEQGAIGWEELHELARRLKAVLNSDGVSNIS
jgi:hypothetical protein